MGWKIVATVLLVTTSLTTGSFAVQPNDPPEVDAGLDQRVYAGTTVLLDGGGTRDPDGTVASYEWTIETPTGTNTTPDCQTCERTRFEPTQTGTYTVTLTATDNDGATRSDTLYVTVRADDGPTVDLDGPRTVTAGSDIEFQATPSPGTEPLVTVNWSIDGTQLPTGNSTTLTRTVTDPGTRTVRVSVTDAIGRTATTKAPLTVEPVPDTPGNDTPPPGDPTDPIFDPDNGSPGGGENNETNETFTLADQYDSTITGPTTVTGDEPLTATYELRSNAPNENVTTIRWVANDAPIASGQTLRATWTPGDQTLKARVTYTDGSTDTARFRDGSTIIEADPAPEPRLGTSTVDGTTLSGALEAIDDYGNLQHVTLSINDTVAFDRNYPPIRRQAPTRVIDTYELTDLEPDTTYNVTLTTADARGQTRTTTRTVRTQSNRTKPEIISAGFTRETADSYHPRIASDRYTVEHVVEIDLNDYPASEVEFKSTDRSKPLIRLSQSSRNYNRHSDMLVIRSAWGGKSPGDYKLDGNIIFNNNENKRIQSKFEVTPSPPELRISSPTEGTRKRVEDWGMIVDASRSFDPDGTNLSIQWLQGAEPPHKNSFTAKLNPYELAGVRIEDETGATAEELGSFLPYYVPRVGDPVQVTEGPYNKSDSVTLELRTESYAFTKMEDRYNITLGARSNSSAVRILSVSKKDVAADPNSNNNGVKQRQHRWVVRVEVEAAALNESDPRVTVYNAEKPQEIFVTKELGDARLRFASEKRDLEIVDQKYEVVNRSGRERRKVIQASTVQKLLAKGWRIESSRQAVDSVLIETLGDVRVTKVRTKRFDSVTAAQSFAKTRPAWTYDGVESSEETNIVVVTKWVRDRAAGRPTGQTRRVLTNPDAVVEQRQYRYVETETVEQQRTVIEEKQKTVTRTRTKEQTICTPIDGCREITEQTSYEETITVEVPVRKTVTVEKQVSKRYWAESPRMPLHTSTGATRVVRTEPRQYATEHQVQVPVERTVTKREYVVSREVMVTRERWQQTAEISSMQRARAIVSNPNKRIGDVVDHTEWVLAKDKPVTEVARTYDSEGNVNTTYATVTGVLEYAPNETREFEIQVEINGYATKEEILETAMSRTMTCLDDTEDCNA